MTNTRCIKCGANLALVGTIHRCIPKAALPHKQDSVPGREWDSRSTRQSAEAVKPPTGARPGIPGTYKYRDPDKWRAYMRDYMRKRRGGQDV